MISSTTSFARAAVLRGIGFLVFWVLLAGPDPSGLVAGILAAVAAGWASLRLLPPQSEIGRAHV